MSGSGAREAKLIDQADIESYVQHQLRLFLTALYMFVCICLEVTDRQVNQLIHEGACSVAEVMRCSGAGTRCGACRQTIATMVGQESDFGASPPVESREADYRAREMSESVEGEGPRCRPVRSLPLVPTAA